MAGGMEFDDIAWLRTNSRAWRQLRADNAPLVRLEQERLSFGSLEGALWSGSAATAEADRKCEA